MLPTDERLEAPSTSTEATALDSVTIAEPVNGVARSIRISSSGTSSEPIRSTLGTAVWSTRAWSDFNVIVSPEIESTRYEPSFRLPGVPTTVIDCPGSSRKPSALQVPLSRTMVSLAPGLCLKVRFGLPDIATSVGGSKVVSAVELSLTTLPTMLESVRVICATASFLKPKTPNLSAASAVISIASPVMEAVSI